MRRRERSSCFKSESLMGDLDGCRRVVSAGLNVSEIKSSLKPLEQILAQVGTSSQDTAQ